MSALWQDLRYAVSTLARRPVFTLVAALSLALGIGLNTAIFTLMNTILLGSLPFRDVDRLVQISSVAPQHPDQPNGGSIPDLFAWKERSRSFEAIGALVNNAVDFGAEENGVPAERVQGENVTPGLLQALGVQPLMGRLFTDADDEVDHTAPVILISHRLWMRRFGGVKDIVNQKTLVNGENTTVIGVMPPDFRFTDEQGDYLAPLPINRFQLRGSARFLSVTAKLKPDVTIKQAQTEMDAIASQLAREFPRDMDHGQPWGVRLQPIREALFGVLSRPLLLLQGAVGFVLLIACANVAALLLSRATSRQTEVAIRAALGASRGRIFRQFLTESLVLSLLGGVLGVALAGFGVQALVAMAPPWLPRLHAIHMDARVLLFSAVVSLLTGLVFGVIPAARGSRLSFAESLKSATRGGTAGGRNRLRAVLVTGQLSMALMLLIGSGLLMRSFLELQGANLGCDPKGILTFRYRFGDKRLSKPVGPYHGLVLWEMSPTPAVAFTEVLDRLQTMPEVRSAAGIVYPPLTGNNPIAFTVDGRTVANLDDLSADFFPITPNFFATMKVPMLRGRDFTSRDTAAAPWVAIVNETMVRRFFPDENPIGKRIRVDLSPEDQPREIIAVVKDIPASHPQTRQDPAIFIPFVQASAHSTGPYTGLRVQMTYLLRTAGQADPMRTLPAVRRAVEEINRNQPLIDPRTEESYLADQAQYPRYYSMLLGLFAIVATGLAAVGIYGVMAYAVEQRTREIGIRMALGAGRPEVLKLIVGQAALMIAAGSALGLAGAIALTRFLTSEIWDVKSNDPGTFAGFTVVLVAIAVLASLIPTLRAVRIDPTVALRYE